MKNFILSNIKNRLGNYATAKKISETLGLSLASVYSLVKLSKIRVKKEYGRSLYSVDDLLGQLDFSDNYNLIENALSPQENMTNNLYNWESRNELESYFESYILDTLGEFTSVSELVRTFKISKNVWYTAIDEGRLLSFSVAKRKVIFTRSLLPFLRDEQA